MNDGDDGRGDAPTPSELEPTSPDYPVALQLEIHPMELHTVKQAWHGMVYTHNASTSPSDGAGSVGRTHSLFGHAD